MSAPSDSEKASSPKEQVVFAFTELPEDPDAGLTDEQKAEVVRYTLGTLS